MSAAEKQAQPKLSPGAFLLAALEREETTLIVPPVFNVEAPARRAPRSWRRGFRRGEPEVLTDRPHRLVAPMPPEVADSLRQGGTLLLVHVPPEVVESIIEPARIATPDKRLVDPSGKVVS